MKQPRIHIGTVPLPTARREPVGEYVTREGEPFYRISDVDAMPEFFMSLVSQSDHWLFTTSRGGITAGRANAEQALFPYYTEDKIRDGAAFTGSRTALLIERDGTTYLWEPLHPLSSPVYRTRQTLEKSQLGHIIIFREENLDLDITFEYALRTSDRFGFIKTAQVINQGDSNVRIDILDGLENLLPFGATTQTQNELSCLLDAYKRSELDAGTGLGIYTMSSTLSDRAEPSEALSATTVWSTGLVHPKVLLSSSQIRAFQQGAPLESELDIRGQRGAYFVNASIELSAGAGHQWHLVAEVNQSAAKTHDLRHYLQTSTTLAQDLEASATSDCRKFRELMASADGYQTTGDRSGAAHHTANVLFNLLRGGAFASGYHITTSHFLAFCRARNPRALEAYQTSLADLPNALSLTELMAWSRKTQSSDLLRLTYEYLPMSFSRRHGDPSRPWNQFNIQVRNPDGSERLYYEGNWRDIFQNWEAAALSYPEYIESMIAKFLNASTADGYNPYRLTSEGIDWETPNPDDPWANIGYWGDHQIIYLVKLLELSLKLHPEALRSLLLKPIFSYANVPYRIRSYEALLKDPRNSIEFLSGLNQQISDNVAQRGTDQRLITDESGQVIHVNMVEKLLVPVLAKLSNFVPEAGIWLNTQRPEWNDANNALAGFGASVVTLCYLHRHLLLLEELLASAEPDAIPIDRHVATFFEEMDELIETQHDALMCSVTDVTRRQVQDQLGLIGSRYRDRLQASGLTGQTALIKKGRIIEFLTRSRSIIAQSIRANRRADGLYHAYNLLKFGASETHVEPLYEMLEGQVAVLSSRLLTADETLTVLEALRRSPIFDPRRNSYQLYPDRTLTPFLQKNTLNADQVSQSRLLKTLFDLGPNPIVEKDVLGHFHFNGAFRNVESLREALAQLEGEEHRALAREESDLLESLFEATFQHHRFTGRSGGMYAYEGLGSIYWHMVGKLMLAVAENIVWATEQHRDDAVIEQLVARYYDIRGGMGFNKSPGEYGAFPDDPYSHTPSFAGAQQPGMTGQVKEEILSRYLELGLRIKDGCISFNSSLIRETEYLTTDTPYDFLDLRNKWRRIPLRSGQYAFSLCQTPFVVSKGPSNRITVQLEDGSVETLEGETLPYELSQSIFSREHHVVQVEVSLATAD